MKFRSKHGKLDQSSAFFSGELESQFSLKRWFASCRLDICKLDRLGNETMCPACDKRCGYFRLKDSCVYAHISYVFDNYATVAFAAVMALWGENQGRGPRGVWGKNNMGTAHRYLE